MKLCYLVIIKFYTFFLQKNLIKLRHFDVLLKKLWTILTRYKKLRYRYEFLEIKFKINPNLITFLFDLFLPVFLGVHRKQETSQNTPLA